MDLAVELNRYAGCEMEIWIEDLSGEEKAKPQNHVLYKAEMSEPGEIRFYMNERQYMSVPVFSGDDTRLGRSDDEYRFVSEDDNAKLVYHVHIHLEEEPMQIR